MKKLLLLLALASMATGISAMQAPKKNSHAPVRATAIKDLKGKDYEPKKDNHPAMRFAVETLIISPEIDTIITQELQQPNPNKSAAREQFNAYMQRSFPDYSQKRKYELMNLFNQTWEEKWQERHSQ